MKKPTPPFGQTQDVNQFNDPTSLNIAPISPPQSFLDQMEEQQTTLLIDDNLIEKTEAGYGSSDHTRLCESCVYYWGIKNVAPVKNLKEDGTPFTQREDFCIFQDKLFALSERLVYSCTRYVKKEEDK